MRAPQSGGSGAVHGPDKSRMKRVDFSVLTPAYRRLLRAARQAASTSYNPYSGFSVGAALLAEDGRIFAASNFETAGGTSICAERSAVVSANAAGCRLFSAIAVVAGSPERPVHRPTAPCGACRQVLYELSCLAGRDLDVILSSTDCSQIVTTSSHELLPMPFGPDDTGVDVSVFRTRCSGSFRGGRSGRRR